MSLFFYLPCTVVVIIIYIFLLYGSSLDSKITSDFRTLRCSCVILYFIEQKECRYLILFSKLLLQSNIYSLVIITVFKERGYK